MIPIQAWRPANQASPYVPQMGHTAPASPYQLVFQPVALWSLKVERRQSFASPPACQLQTSLTPNEHCRDSDVTSAHASSCHQPVSPPVVPRCKEVAIFFFKHTQLGIGSWAPVSLSSPKIDAPCTFPVRSPQPSMQARVFGAMTHCQKAMQSRNLHRYLHFNVKHLAAEARQDPSQFRSNPIKLENINDSRTCRVKNRMLIYRSSCLPLSLNFLPFYFLFFLNSWRLACKHLTFVPECLNEKLFPKRCFLICMFM